MTKQFQLWVTVVSWHDGDTCLGVCDLSCHTFLGRLDKPIRFRCALINAPELATPEGPAARDFAATLAPPGEYPCTSTGLDNYGRPLLDLHLPDGRLFSAAMLTSGHAVLYR